MATAITARILFTLICLMAGGITAATELTRVPILTTPILATRVDLLGEVPMQASVQRLPTAAGLVEVGLSAVEPARRRQRLRLARLRAAVQLAAAAAVSNSHTVFNEGSLRKTQ